MDKTFFIGISMRTLEELIPLARFPIGGDKEFAEELYDSLKGSATGLDESPLLMEWTEEQSGLPQNLCLRACSLKDMAHNCELITKALFRKHTLR